MSRIVTIMRNRHEILARAECSPSLLSITSHVDHVTHALAEYEEAVATTHKLLAELDETLRRLAIAITRREDRRAALEHYQHKAKR